MNKFYRFAFFITASVFSSTLYAQSADVFEILKLQDQRKPASAFAQFLKSPNTENILFTLQAFGSIQDSSSIDLTTPFLKSEYPEIRKAAAFALGQTGKNIASNELETALLKETDPDVLEEMSRAFGRVATVKQIEKLPSKFGETFFKKDIQRGFSEILLRASIRSVSSDSLVRFAWVMTSAKDEITEFKSLYALTRFKKPDNFGKDLLFSGRYFEQSPSPHVRMYWASLLGFGQDTTIIIEKLGLWLRSESDPRVRTNIVRSLGKFGTIQAVNYIMSASTDPIGYVQSAAQTVIMGLKTVQKDQALSQTVLKHVENRLKNISDPLSRNDIEWLMLGYKLKPDFKHVLLDKVRNHPNPLHRNNFPFFISLSYNFDQMTELENMIKTEPMNVKTTALSGWVELCHKAIPEKSTIKEILQYAFSTRDMAMITIASDAIKDTIFQYDGYENDLIQLLPTLDYVADVEAIQSILTTMGETDNPVFASSLKTFAGNPYSAISSVAVKSYLQITGETLSVPPPKEIQTAAPDKKSLEKYWKGATVRINTTKGEFSLDVMTQKAPMTSLAFIKLFDSKFYQNLYFHRVVPNFVAQGGDPRGDGWGGPGYTLRSEFSTLQYSDEGWVGVASAGKDTEGCQFFIVHSATPHLDGRYTIFAKVSEGMDVVQKLEVGDQILSTSVSQK